MKRGFTLAGVLITLGIIGLVAAMTIPTLITIYNDKVLEIQRVRTQSILANAFKMIMANDNATSLSTSSLAACGSDSSCYAENLGKVLKIIAEIDSDADDAKISYSFLNGDGEVWSSGKLYT